MVQNDLTVPIGGGFLNIRVGAIIMRHGKILMVRNARNDYYYSVGGRIQFGESAEEAVQREVSEETGAHMAVDYLGFIHENFFYGDAGYNQDKPIYEISFYFYMKVPDDFVPHCESYDQSGVKEHLEWVSPDTEKQLFPFFFRDALHSSNGGIKHFVTHDEPSV
ncbi:MAG: NUDIX domain-containing protein [Oscillospiraceae bacterium]|nr:NUDIX domain-containing protein [Oscillospiraceae bacterium]